MRIRTVVLCAAALAALVGCSSDSTDVPARTGGRETVAASPSIANFVGRTKGETEAALSDSGVLFGFRDTEKEYRSGPEYDSWVVCGQEVNGQAASFTVAASRQECGLPPDEETPEVPSKPSGASESPETDDSTQATERDSRYAAAVKAQAPSLARAEDGALGAQGQAVCTLLDMGDSPEEVVETMQGGYPGEAGRVMVIKAPPVYCPEHSASVSEALE